MRLIFIFLFVANVAFFASVYLSEETKQGPSARQSEQGAMEPQNNLVLLSEQQGGAEKKIVKPNVLSSAITDVSRNDLCTMVGPYAQLLHAEYLVEKLQALGVAAQVTSVGIKDGDMYWVYLQPEMSEKEALRRLYELQRKNIESYIITKGELTNGISFGRYGDPAEADQKMRDVKAQGYDAQILVVPKLLNETWVLLERSGEEKISASVWSELLAQHKNLEKRQNLCLGVASQ
ncbi:SPOR domain-containing protein [Cellvibrio japonicus]|uniref:Sporulation related repeat family n=1 Tax=Cellvibrio japonicus (strain Ueda107) TaxID=498211 RepID=B3PK22_CELJU|nr:SPOR domain-containing protein [Cellvibrio japonicus]ACE85353.1 Sporulation related repeat family [Cellvibrio japonicus Ueda107]QEI11344.1 SPOR domain-containing protein [Cellvibrio japonicus]QEI14918.1 SPOR domain-containing protein [Cellvibrio japonicus]QEI18498.1 SPOR domain-containing protein [Cellvibrio japonicus]